ncbi:MULTISPECIES: hypothetical protein [Providencia]|uniref:hypothetical protein n=1 Tax=Providencia TaxID=586 RepID=UPI0015EB7E9A|nr:MULTISPECIES: hypothetical protein [unclassified Providencia]EJD6081639.1 hypothetical protein [Providencia rettgeri]EJD6598770.1 hypothetical protein [Providencia rettgeri]ELR5173129.1 hypothetical protein [Providencia rettgeri]ELR5195427.1 hypothetical protein [Providencia rettgeri]QLQ99405.1 hypothetical protein H0912_09515 [Providencia rettgeri]
MLFQDHVVEVLKSGKCMTIKEIMSAIESKGVKAPYNTVYFAVKQLERFFVVSKHNQKSEDSSMISFKLKPDYETGLDEQKDARRRQVGQLSRLDFKGDKGIRKKSQIARQGFKQVGEPARQQVWLNELLAKPRAKRIKRGLAV